MDGGEARHTIHLHNVETARLEPDTIYRYQIQTVKSSRSMWSDVYEFRSPTSFEWFEFLATADMVLKKQKMSMKLMGCVYSKPFCLWFCRVFLMQSRCRILCAWSTHGNMIS